jgi:hypothetical protein
VVRRLEDSLGSAVDAGHGEARTAHPQPAPRRSLRAR